MAHTYMSMISLSPGPSIPVALRRRRHDEFEVDEFEVDEFEVVLSFPDSCGVAPVMMSMHSCRERGMARFGDSSGPAAAPEEFMMCAV